MTAFTYRMNAGIPGDLTRKERAVVEAQMIASGEPPTQYGDAVKMEGGLIEKIDTGDVAADVYGLLVRPFPTHAGTDGLDTSTPPTSGICDVLRSGYINVLLHGATAATKGGTVYVRVANAATGKPIGGFEAAADNSNTIVVANATFTGPADASGNTEVAFNI